MTSLLAYLDTIDPTSLIGWSLIAFWVAVAAICVAAAWEPRPARRPVTRAVSSARKSPRTVVGR